MSNTRESERVWIGMNMVRALHAYSMKMPQTSLLLQSGQIQYMSVGVNLNIYARVEVNCLLHMGRSLVGQRVRMYTFFSSSFPPPLVCICRHRSLQEGLPEVV